MKIAEIKKEIETFYTKVKEYRALLVESRNQYFPDIEKNHTAIVDSKRSLIRDYAKLEPYILKFGKNPKMNDGVWNVWFSPYENAFSNDILLRVGPSIDAVVNDLDFIIGKLESKKQSEEIIIPPEKAEETKEADCSKESAVLIRIDNAINLAEQKLLKGEELNELVSSLKTFKPEAARSEVPKRKLEKIQREPNTVWSDPKGYAIGGLELLAPWRDVFLELIPSEQAPAQKYFRPGSRDEIFSYLKPLVSSAKVVKIYDNYLGDEVLKLLETTAADSDIFVLGGGGEVDKRFIDKAPAFVIYFGRKLKARKVEKFAHARFYIVDGIVFHVDPSLKGKGADKATIISPVEKSEAEKIISDFDNWWNVGETLL